MVSQESLGQDKKLILASVFLMKIGQFMALPFLAIFLVQNTMGNAAQIGIILGIGPLVYGVFGLPAGILVDRLGTRATVLISLFACGITTGLMLLVYSLKYIFFLNALNGVSRTLFDVSTKSYGVSGISPALRKKYFGWRFVVNNAGAAFGPALGGYFAAINSSLSFELTGLVYLFVGLVLCFCLSEEKRVGTTHVGSFDVKPLIRDKSLAILFVICLLVWVAYSQIDTVYPQYLHAEMQGGVRFYSLLLVLNAVCCALFQRSIAKVTDRLAELRVVCLSMFCFALGYLLIALTLVPSLLVVSMMLIVIGESIILPFNDYLLGRISRSKNVGAYYGIITMSMAGLGLGPILGGFVYHHYNAECLFISCGVICLAVIFLYSALLKREVVAGSVI